LRRVGGIRPVIHVLAWRFAKVSNFAETATFLRQIASDVMSHAQIPAMQWFWGMHGLVLETSIWLLAESTRSQLLVKTIEKSFGFCFGFSLEEPSWKEKDVKSFPSHSRFKMNNGFLLRSRDKQKKENCFSIFIFAFFGDGVFWFACFDLYFCSVEWTTGKKI
jgi:hypothetical protein